MAFTMETKTTLKKGDIVVYENDDYKSAYVLKEIHDNGYATLYGVRLTEMKDDVIIMFYYVPLDEIHLADDSMYNQIGYLMKIRKKVLDDNIDFFAFKG